MRIFFTTLAFFALLSTTVALIGFILLVEPGSEGRSAYLGSSGRLYLYQYGLLDQLPSKDIRRLYESVCTRKCHSRDVIEKTPRTAMEWERIVTRMRTSEQAGKRADISDREATTITEYLQRNFLSNVPTVLPEHVMRFLKKHLWRMDFGESDLYLDVILLPKKHRNLSPYLVMDRSPRKDAGTLFVMYVNTHQAILPPWDLARMATLTRHDKNRADGHGVTTYEASAWEVLYEDGQLHHRQGILTFPRMEGNGEPETLEMTIRLPNMRKRVFQWSLPVPPLEENG